MQEEIVVTNEKNNLSPKLDVIFQALFGEVGNEEITKRFLEAILDKKIESIDLSKNPILRREQINDKLGVLDVIAKINNQESCDIEMQMAPKDKIIERLLYYWARTYTKQIKSGNTYDKLHKTIAILIANFRVPGLEDLCYHTSWKIIEEKYRKTILTDSLEIRIIELPKIANLQKEDNELLDWLFFLENPNSERVIKKMKINKELKQANEKLKEISQDEHMQRIAEWRYKAILDENTARVCGYKNGKAEGYRDGKEEGLKKGHEEGREEGREEGIKEGIEQGIEQGIEKNTIETAIKLLEKGLDISLIQDVTGLSLKRIEELKKQLKN